jgi:hypothetical protein
MEEGFRMTDLPIPERLRAGAAMWSLRAALALLVERDAQEARAIADERAAAADPLRSPMFGQRRALGGHSDPTSEALLLLGDSPRDNRYSRLADEVAEQLTGVVQHLPAGGHDSLARIEAAIPAMSKTAAKATWHLLDRIDGRIRRLLGERQDQQFIPRARCPWCDAVSLVVRLSPPRPARVVECTICDGAWTWDEMARQGATA